MKKTILKYGGYSALFEFIFFVLVWLFLGLVKVSHDLQGTIGFFVILCPLVFVYFGIRYYRDQCNNGHISFLHSLGIGMLIVTVPALSYALIETVYVLYIDPKFYENIANFQIAAYRKSLPPVQFAIKLKEIKEQLVIDNQPVYNFTAMVLIIAALGAIVTVVSSLLLMRRKPKAALNTSTELNPAR